MWRVAPIAAILISFSIVGCESLASQSGGPAKGGTASTPAAGSAAGAAAGQASAAGSGHSEFPLIAGLTVAGIGYVLLQVYAGGSSTGSSSGVTGFFGHVMTGGSAIIIRLFDNVMRFIASEVTRTPQIPVSLITGNPNPKATYDPRPATASPVAGLGLGLAKHESLMQDIRSSSDRSASLAAQELEQPVGAGSNGKS
jgi:hypothetical protein